MPLLFEYGDWVDTHNKAALKQMLRDIWQNRQFVDLEAESDENEQDTRFQPFLQFDDNQIRANNYVGFIQNGEELIEIYPKVFRDVFEAEENKALMLRHIFYWFSYCRKWRFPFNKAALDTIHINTFPELIINLIANQFLETISDQPLSMYQHLEEVMTTPRGSINFKRYINNSLTHGNPHNIECDHEPFLYDNKVNRAIKYCSRLLLNQTKFNETIQALQEVLFILDEVEDSPCTINDIEAISINTFFQEYLFILDSCKLILNQQLYSSNPYDFSHWCLLFPMEYIFEDFFAGFLSEHFSEKWNIEYQKSNKSLATTSDNKNVFKMQHDIFITAKHNKNQIIIIDTKYKFRNIQDKKKGIEQNDLYQITSYAFRRGCTDVFLIYPNFSESLKSPDKFKIQSGFHEQEKINITAVEIPFWSFSNFEGLKEELIDFIEHHIDFHQTKEA